MLNLALAIGTVVLILVSPPMAAGNDGEEHGLVKVGESVYRGYCTSCHGAAAKGDGRLAESLRPAPSDLTLIAQKNGGRFPFQTVVKKIDGTTKVRGHGSSDMPVWGQAFKRLDESATDEQVQDKVVALAHYLRSLQVANDRRP